MAPRVTPNALMATTAATLTRRNALQANGQRRALSIVMAVLPRDPGITDHILLGAGRKYGLGAPRWNRRGHWRARRIRIEKCAQRTASVSGVPECRIGFGRVEIGRSIRRGRLFAR